MPELVARHAAKCPRLLAEYAEEMTILREAATYFAKNLQGSTGALPRPFTEFKVTTMSGALET